MNQFLEVPRYDIRERELHLGPQSGPSVTISQLSETSSSFILRLIGDSPTMDKHCLPISLTWHGLARAMIYRHCTTSAAHRV